MTYRIDYSAKGMIARVATAELAKAFVDGLGTVVMIEEDADHPDHFDCAIMVGLADLQIITITPEA